MEERKPRINIIPGDTGACGYYRLTQAANLLQMFGQDVTLSPEHTFRAIGQDIIYTQRLCSEGALKPMLEFKEKTGIKIYVDFDDMIWNYKGEGLPEYNWCRKKVDTDKNTVAMAMYLDKVADKISVSTEYLKETLKQFVDESKITVLPNMLSARDWLFQEATTVPKEDIFYFAGSDTHYNNELKLPGDFSQGMIRYLSNKKIITIASTPYFMNPIKQYPGATLNVYPKHFCSQARLAKFVLVPLADNIFNKAKSDLKYLECAAVGRVALVNDFPGSPYEHAHPLQKIPVGATYKTIEFIVKEAQKHYGEILKYQYEYLNKRWLDNNIQSYVNFLK